MKNKKGFTLVELMAVIAIIAILILIAVPSAIAISHKVKNNMYDKKIEIIESAAKLYGDENSSVVGESIKVQDLVDNGYLKKDDSNGNILDPRDNSSLNCKKITIFQKNSRIYATYDKNDNTECSSNNNSSNEGSSSESVNFSSFQLGDYVKMTPTSISYTINSDKTGYTSTQTINPSELNIWRIISINSNGTYDVVSEYASSTYIFFTGKIGYKNLIGTLNEIANQYQNSAFTINARHMGYGGGTLYISNTEKLDQTIPWTASTSSSTTLADEQLGAGDMGYLKDCDLVKKALGTLKANKVRTTTATAYWLASRSYGYYGSDVWSFYAMCATIFDDVYDTELYSHNNGYSDFYSHTYPRAIRPIITLKADVKPSSGDGQSEATAYVLK